MKRSYEDILSEYGNTAYDESSTLITRVKKIINTPVKYEQKSASIFDSDGRQVGAYIPEEQGDELAKRINLHDELVKSLKDMVEIVGGNFCQNMEIKRKYKEARELLEKCK